MPTPQEIRDDIDTRLAALWSQIQTRQAAYFAARGRYFQGLRTHATVPADGTPEVPDRFGDRPTDQAESWNDVALTPGPAPFALELHAYRGPEGPGFLAIVAVRILGTLFRRRKDSGAQPWRDTGWQT
jgi:hypothetical protein